jgi:20S proteasome alpha/beta subunit
MSLWRQGEMMAMAGGLPRLNSSRKSFREPVLLDRRLSMTICAAVMCRLDKRQKRDCILCISDRQITWSDYVKTEARHQTKGFGLAPVNALAFFAGDPDDHQAIVTKAHQKAIDKQTTNVRQVAQWYSRNMSEYQREESRETDVEAIIAGFDSGGSHIYHIDDGGHVRCLDNAGFCVIGSGASLFNRHFKLSGYNRFWGLHDTLLLMYESKKKAEDNIYVGSATDVFFIHDKDNGRLRRAVKALESYYRKLNKAIQAKRKDLLEEMAKDSRFLPPG